MRQWKYRDETGRVCTKCDTYKPWSEYNRKSDGHRPDCRECQKAIERNYKRDPVKHRLAMRRYYYRKKEAQQNASTIQEDAADSTEEE